SPDQSLHLQDAYSGENLRDSHLGVEDDVVDARRVALDGFQYGGLRLIELQLDRMADFAAVVAWRGGNQRAQLLQHVVHRFDQLRSVPNQSVAAARVAAIDASGDGEDVAALFHGMA